MTTLPDLEPAALDVPTDIIAAAKNAADIVGVTPYSDMRVHVEQAVRYALVADRAARSVPEAGKAVDFPDIESMMRHFGHTDRVRQGSRADYVTAEDWTDYTEVPDLVLDRIRAALASVAPSGAEPVAGPLMLAAHRTRAEEALCALEWALEALRHSEPISKQYPEPCERHENALKLADATVARLRSSTAIPSKQAVPAEDIAGLDEGLRSHVGHSMRNGTWFVRLYPFASEAAAKAFEAHILATAPQQADIAEIIARALGDVDALERYGCATDQYIRPALATLSAMHRDMCGVAGRLEYRAETAERKLEEAPNDADIYDQAATLAVPAKDGGTYFDGIEAYRLQLTLKAAQLRLDGTSLSGASE
jgi:hypothetical protein